MNHEESAALLHFAGQLDGRISRTLADPSAAARMIARWAEALPEVPSTTADGRWDVSRAVRRYYEQRGGDHSARFFAVEPHHVLSEWATHREAALGRHTDPLPAADPDRPEQWREELLGTRRAVATGAAAPADHRALTSGGPAPAVADAIRSAGRRIPPAVAAQLAPYRPTRAARDQALATGRPDPLSVPCTWCAARPGQPCRQGKGRTPRATPHPSRIEAAARAAGQETAA
ncbi:hypothetical protein ACFC1B_26950 [Streptomyces xiamenensis]|uniref:zinc finger domain-containing protein n=1 Tax=Streptomyces xiamenensis TaxID=408015 RepID=UPI0035DBC29F